MSAYQRTKGHSFERMIASTIRGVLPGATVRRSQQGDGAHEPDVVIEGAAPELAKRLWLECQHSATPDPAKKLRQAEDDAPAGRLPIAVTHRTGARRDPIQATMRIATLMEIMGGRLPIECDHPERVSCTVSWGFVLSRLPDPGEEQS